MSKQSGQISTEQKPRLEAERNPQRDIVSVERITLDGNEVHAAMLSGGIRALRSKEILPLLEREKRHTRGMLCKRHPEYILGRYAWGIHADDVKYFFSRIGAWNASEVFYPLSPVIDLFRYHAKFRDTKSANLLKDLEEYAIRPHAPNVPEPVDGLDTAPPHLDKFTEGVISNLSDALASCKDGNKRSEVVSVIQSLIKLL